MADRRQVMAQIQELIEKQKANNPLDQEELNLLNLAANQPAAVGGLPVRSQDSKKKESQQVVPTFVGPEDFTRASKFVDSLPAFQEQRESSNAALESLDPEALLGAPQKDLTPLLALADAWSGGKSNLAGAYSKPTSTNERAKMIAGLQDMIRKNNEGITDAQKEYLKLALSGKKVSTVSDIEKTGNLGGSSGTMDFKRYQDGFMKDPLVQDARKNITTAKTIEKTLKNPNAVGDVTTVREIAKAYNSGALTDRDVADFASPGDMFDKISNFLAKKGTGKMDDTTRQYFLQFAKNMRERRADQLKDHAEKYAQDIGPVYGYEPNSAYKYLEPHVWEDSLNLSEKEEAERQAYERKKQAIEAKMQQLGIGAD